MLFRNVPKLGLAQCGVSASCFRTMRCKGIMDQHLILMQTNSYFYLKNLPPPHHHHHMHPTQKARGNHTTQSSLKSPLVSVLQPRPLVHLSVWGCKGSRRMGGGCEGGGGCLRLEGLRGGGDLCGVERCLCGGPTP